MRSLHGTLLEETQKIDENELIYIGTKSGSGFFFIGTKSEFNEEVKSCYDRQVDDIYPRTTAPEEYGTIIIIRGGAVRGTHWFHEEYLAANSLLKPFNPVQEIKHGRYQLGDRDYIGKFNRLYYEIRLDYFGCQFPLATFQSDDIKLIRGHHLPGGCFIPTEAQMKAWLTEKFGEKWHKKPQEILKEFGLDLYGNAFDGRVTSAGKFVCLATDSFTQDGNRISMQIDPEGVYFRRSASYQCAFVPVFFTKNYRESILFNPYA